MNSSDQMMHRMEYNKFCKAFSTRMVQALVQSRMGEAISQSCVAQPENSDWFNIRIDEYGEIAAYMRANVTNYPPVANKFTLEFLLYTAKKDVLPLESWCIRFDDSFVDETSSDSTRTNNTQIYHQLGTLLKSIMIAARVTPLFRYYVRKQCSDTFVILYRVHENETELNLGVDYREVRLGNLPSPYGVLSVDLMYRTRMEIIPLEKCDETTLSSPLSTALLQPSNPESSIAILFGTAVPSTQVVVISTTPVSDIISNFSASPASQFDAHLGCTPPRRIQFNPERSISSPTGLTSVQTAAEFQSVEDNIFVMESYNGLCDSTHLHSQTSVETITPKRNNSFPFAALLDTTNLQQARKFPYLYEEKDINEAHPTALECPSSQSQSSQSTVLPERSIYCSALSHDEVRVLDQKQVSSSIANGVQVSGVMNNDSDSDDSSSGDSSYVMVAFGSNDDLEDDLSTFMHQCKMPPPNLSFSNDDTSVIPELLDGFEKDKHKFNEFLAEVKEKTNRLSKSE